MDFLSDQGYQLPNASEIRRLIYSVVLNFGLKDNLGYLHYGIIHNTVRVKYTISLMFVRGCLNRPFNLLNMSLADKPQDNIGDITMMAQSRKRSPITLIST